jgi:hypothetical protein
MWYFNPGSFGFAEFAAWEISDKFDGCGVFKEYKLSANSSTAPLLKYPVPEGQNNNAMTPAVEYTGTERGWYQAQAYAVSQGGRLMTRSEMWNFLSARGNQAVYGGDHWVAVDSPRDWIQVGSSHYVGKSYRNSYNRYPSWGDNSHPGSHARTVGIARFSMVHDCPTANKCL